MDLTEPGERGGWPVCRWGGYENRNHSTGTRWKSVLKSSEPSATFDGNILGSKSAQSVGISDEFANGRLTWNSTPHEGPGYEAENRDRPNDTNDRPGVSPPGSAPFNLPPQNNMAATQICCEPGTKHAQRSTLLWRWRMTKSQQKKTCHVRGSSCRGRRKPSGEESDTGEEPGEGKDPERRLETEG